MKNISIMRLITILLVLSGALQLTTVIDKKSEGTKL